ncbi:hypothetical protein, partial [Devosia indica]
IDADSGRAFGAVGLHADLQVMFGDLTLAERWPLTTPIGSSRKRTVRFERRPDQQQPLAMRQSHWLTGSRQDIDAIPVPIASQESGHEWTATGLWRTSSVSPISIG